MKQHFKHLTVTLAFLCCVACGIPMVPDETALIDKRSSSRMTKVMECRLLNVSPHIQSPDNGPEPDIVPMLIPLPESAGTKAFVFIPSVQDAAGNKIFDNLEFMSSSSAGMVFGLLIDPTKAVHEVDLPYQGLTTPCYEVNLPSSSPNQKRFDLSLFRSTPAADSRLLISCGNTYSSSYRGNISMIDFPATALTDAPSPLSATFSQSSYDTKKVQNKWTAAYYDLSAWTYSIAKKTSSYYSASSSIPISQTWTYPSPQNILAIPANGSFKVIFRSGGSFFCTSFVPGSASSPEAASYTSPDAYPVPPDNFLAMQNTDLKNVFLTYNPRLFSGAISIAFYHPTDNGAFSYYQSLNNYGWTSTGPVDTAAVPVRALQDGSLLSLKDEQWHLASYGPDGLIASTLGATFETGNLQFLFEYNDDTDVWMYFSQAITVPGSLGKGNDLILRSWKIKESDFLNPASSQ